jgi:gamma-glutamyl hydrolase
MGKSRRTIRARGENDKNKNKTSKTNKKSSRSAVSKKIILINGVGSKNVRSSSKTRKIKVKKVDYAKRCKNMKSHEFMREVYSKNLSNRVTRKFKKGVLKDKFFLNHKGNIGSINSGKWTNEMRRQYKIIRQKYGMKPKELNEFKSDYKCNMFRTITKNHNQIVIGVLSIPTTTGASLGATSYIPQSYVKWLEMHGARVVPIMFDIPKQIINVILNQIDGLLLIGGTIESIVVQKAHYRFLSTLRYIVNKITHFNLIGNHFPIFSICLGFQLLPMICDECSVDKISDNFVNHKKISFLRKYGPEPVKFLPVENRDMTVSPPMQDYFSKTDKDEIARDSCTAMIHNKSFIMNAKYMKEYNKYINVTATSSADGKQYVAAYQFKSLPFYGVQFHPEKVFYEHIQENIPHGSTAKMFSSKLCQMFMKECSKNYNIHVFGANDDANFFIENYDLLSRENAINILFPHRSKLFNTSMVGASYYFGRTDSTKSDILGVPMVSKSESVKPTNETELYRSIAVAKEREKDFHYPI